MAECIFFRHEKTTFVPCFKKFCQNVFESIICQKEPFRTTISLVTGDVE